jgi:ubiquinone/menaquinone biosynthesis C-methylase UbiE
MTPAEEREPGSARETADVVTSSDDYAARFSGAAGAWMLAVQERITRRMLADLPGASVVDVGGGHGQLAVPLSRSGFAVTVVGSDASCRRRVAEVVDAGLCRFVAGHVVALPFPDHSFDVAMSFRLLPHCARWPELIRELCRVARRRVIVDYPTTRSVNAIAPAVFGLKKKVERNTREWTLFRRAQIVDEFARQGFRPVAEVGQFFFPMALHRALKCRPLSAGLEAAARVAGLTRLFGSPVIASMAR